MKVNLKAAIFDVYETIASFSPSREVVQKEVTKKYGLSLSNEGIAKGYLAADKMLAQENRIRPVFSLSKKERDEIFGRYEAIVLKGSGHVVSSALASDIWKDVRDFGTKLTLFNDVVPTLKRLALGGVLCGIISNIGVTGTSLVADLGLEKLIDFAITSKDVNVAKPSGEIFKLALLKAGVDAQNACYVGDQIETDVEAANKVGMVGVLVDRSEQHKSYSKSPRFIDLNSFCDWVLGSGT